MPTRRQLPRGAAAALFLGLIFFFGTLAWLAIVRGNQPLWLLVSTVALCGFFVGYLSLAVVRLWKPTTLQRQRR